MLLDVLDVGGAAGRALRGDPSSGLMVATEGVVSPLALLGVIPVPSLLAAVGAVSLVHSSSPLRVRIGERGNGWGFAEGAL